MKKKRNTNTVRMIYSSMLLALAILLPFLTSQIPHIGRMLAPMHIPVILCGFICGRGWGLAVGACAPILRSLMFGSPVMMPNAVGMACELAVYGFASGALYKALPKNIFYHYLTLIASMLAGRAVWGLVRFLLAGLQNTEFTFSAFLAGAFTQAFPGIILQLILIPPIICALRKNRMMLN